MQAKYTPIIFFGGGAVVNRGLVGRGRDVVSGTTDVASDLAVRGVGAVVNRELVGRGRDVVSGTMDVATDLAVLEAGGDVVIDGT